MNVKAEAYQEWNQAAVVDKLLTNMADVVRAMAEPLSKVDKITIVSTGNDGAAGVNKITGDMTKIAAQVPALFEALSGMDIKQLMSNVQAIKQKTGEWRGNARRCALSGTTRLRERVREAGALRRDEETMTEKTDY